MGVLLFIIAYILFLPLTVANFFFVKDKKGYFKNSAINIDKFGNREFRTILNSILIVETSAFRFGNINETISSVLGKNQKLGLLTKTGKVICYVLDFLDKNHCEKSIDLNINFK